MSIYQIVVKAVANDNDELRNIHHYEFGAYVPDASQLQELVDGIDTAYKSNLQSDYADAVDFYAYDARRVDVGNLPVIELLATAGGWSGTATGDPLPSQCAAMVTWKAPTVFPRSTRSYMFPFAVASCNAIGRVQAAIVGHMVDFAADMIEHAVTGATDPCKVAVKYGGTPRAVIEENDVVTNVVRNVYRTQRRRTPGVGI